MTASPSVRGLRAAVFAALCVLLAVGAHELATGEAPPVWAQGVAFVPVFTVAFLAGGRERRILSLGGGTFTVQGGLHFAFDAVRPHAMAAAHMGHTHAASAHVTAALVLTWWLRRGEAALWSLLRRAVALVPGLVAWWRGRGVPAVPRAACRGTGAPRPPRRLLLRHAVQRRGPPPGISYAI